MRRIIAFQFGSTYQRRAAGYTLVGCMYASPCYLWSAGSEGETLVNPVGEGAHLDVVEPLLEGFAYFDRPAIFQIGLPDENYRLTMTSYDRWKSHGPFTVKANDLEKISGCAIAANNIAEQTFQCDVTGGVLRLEFVPESGKDFLLNALVVEGPDDAEPQPIFRTAPPVSLPDKEELAANSEDDPAKALRKICDWLVGQQGPARGFLGEADGGWYTAAFATRTLLAAYDVLGEEQYLEAACACLDLLVGEQLPTGAFLDGFRGIPTSDRSDAEVREICRTERQPMSDIGSMVSALAIGSTYVEAERKERYLRSLKLFCDEWAPRFQHPSGAFSDGPTLSPLGEIYSCATAIEAAAFSLACAATGDNGYLKVAGDAIRYLLQDWFRDGRMIGRSPHWISHNRLPFVLEPLHFGEHYYFDEGFITTAYHTRDEELRGKIGEAMQWRVFGQCGLLAALDGRSWWPVEHDIIWYRAKSAGMPQTLLYEKRRGHSTPELAEALDCMRKVLCTHEYARRLGVVVEDEERPAAIHGHATWSGMRMEATGFAGMTLAEMIKPGVLYLAASE